MIAWRGVAGYSVDMLGQMKESLAGSLQQDTAAISPQRCISLYLERLGCAPDAASPRLKVRLPADPHRGTSFSVLEAHALAALQQNACREKMRHTSMACGSQGLTSYMMSHSWQRPD